MKTEYNSQAFTPNEVEEGLHLELIKFLLKMNSKSDSSYNDIHITTDGFCTIVEWNTAFFDIESGRFMYVGEEEVIKLEKLMPDDTYELFNNEEEYKERLKELESENE